MYLIQEIELELGAEGRAEVRIDLPMAEAGRAGQGLVLIERLDAAGQEQAEDDAPFDAWVRDGVLPNLPTDGARNARVFAGGIRVGAQELAVGVSGAVGQRFRVFIGWARRGIREQIDKLPCTVCRKALKAAIRAALASAGIPTPGELTANLVGSILAGLAKEGIAAFLYELFGEGIADRLGRMIEDLLRFVRAIDELCYRLCMELGMCPEPG